MKSQKPSQYTKGWVEFYKLKFKVTPDVLIPRPETELLVDELLKYILRAKREVKSSLPHQNGAGSNNNVTVLDLGTGSGNIAISLAKNLNGHPRGVRIIATDISKKALKVAKQNAKFHGVEHKITFLESNLLSNVPRPEDICVIIANLPYIPSARIPYLDSSVKDFEPIIALDGGKDGFDLYRKLFQQISKLQTGFEKLKLMVCEIDYTHGELAIHEALKYFPNAQVEVKTDLAKKQRILKITD